MSISIMLTHCFVATSDLKKSHIIGNSQSFQRVEVNFILGFGPLIGHKSLARESTARASFGRLDYALAAAACMARPSFVGFDGPDFFAKSSELWNLRASVWILKLREAINSGLTEVCSNRVFGGPSPGALG